MDKHRRIHKHQGDPISLLLFIFNITKNWLLDVSQRYGSSRPVAGMSFTFHLFNESRVKTTSIHVVDKNCIYYIKYASHISVLYGPPSETYLLKRRLLVI
jgi:hypothetical protein